VKINYVVSLAELPDGTVVNVLCRNNQVLADLMANVDEEKYSVVNIVTVANGITEDVQEVCKKDEKLETGETETKEEA